MRLFVALVPPPDVLDELEEAVRPHADAVPGLRWIRRDLMHVTLTFLGEVDDRTLERLLPRLERAVGRHERMALSLAGAGAFPGSGAHARVLWTGLYGDRRRLARLAASTTAAGRRVGTLPDKHKGFRPHMTLARTRRPVDVRNLIEALSSFAGASWTAESVHLMRSRLPGKDYSQVTYEPLKTWSLRHSSGGGGAGRSASGGPQGTP
ncbi:RNA 2',3'-cyclic phosphodiesterase [Actinomadura madurae]|uniref:RNA 2',3'-cyclic phosphodiesterase n=2 Tax=Actinomadura madurae TaxID=1993 RepID=UPI0020271195|nr:RNA 2',3'-cyclic phosphodiesterase [Actinomadura madurae]MCP9953236.1 RNA 2',3'-cyclic phosphodiesterase [Actinomadura madurae]MCP9970000.1 RNA 2',3'-cyclic phosphodiesterase [Actinomadura madurae]MCQ0006013.1 RNA 2',3'-cyclic phosphodiesterase [Actinomadura madurae]MCQ0018701.1 RNA 2',3'-cyclic phosphodiesterase [Actinomadura madurae]URM98705.1 RNA 2',3'-cyclic phosphodiesterase [Actinomadura madurae]